MSSHPPRSWDPAAPPLSPAVTEARALAAALPPSPAAAQRLLDACRPPLAEALGTAQTILILPQPAEALHRALCAGLGPKRRLHFVTGPDSAAWHAASAEAPGETLKIGIPFGAVIAPEGASALLSKAPELELITLHHAEPASGILEPLRELSPGLHSQPGALIAIDASASATTTELAMDRDRIDLILASGSAFGAPHTLSVLALSGKAIDRLEAQVQPEDAEGLSLLEAIADPAAPWLRAGLSDLAALAAATHELSQEGLPARISRHWRLAARARAFAKERLALASADGYSAYALTCIRAPRDLNLDAFLAEARAAGHILGPGRGELTGRGFTIAHTGATSLLELEALLATLAELHRAQGSPQDPETEPGS